MGIVEATLRKSVHVGEIVDVTLIGGRELRGKITAFAEDGILLQESGYERPVAFAGIATFIPMRYVKKNPIDAEKIAAKADEAECIKEEPVLEIEEVVTQEEGWIERYENAAGVGSIICNGQYAVFKIEDVLDQQLADQLTGWFGRAIAVQFSLHVKGAMRTATGITERRTQDKFDKNEGQKEQSGERHGFGEILHFDKQGGFGKACEGNVKFIFRKEDIVSDALWQEIIQSANTCGIKIAFTVVQDGKNVKYTCLREISELQTPDEVQTPDFAAVIPVEPEKDVNPHARETFTDGTTMEEEEHVGYVIFYNADKYFGRLQQENGDRYYFRANDVMQKSLMDYLNEHPDVADTSVTFSVKHLPTGKTAAGRVRWNAPRPARTPGAAEKPVQPAVSETPVETAKEQSEPAPARKNDGVQLNGYCENMLELWNVTQEQLSERLCSAAEQCADAEIQRDLMLENVALSDARREKRDDAMLRYLRLFAREGGSDQLSSFLGAASYNGTEMFDALTQLFAVSDGACGRLCGIIASDGGLVMLRGEILSRFGQVPETASGLKELWKPLIEEERAKTAYGRLLPAKEALNAVDPDGEHEDWKAVLEDYAALERGENVDAAAIVQRVRAVREGIAQKPSRLAVEWMLPILKGVQEKLDSKGDAQGLALRALCAVRVGEKRWACAEITGAAQDAVVKLGEDSIRLGTVKGSVQAAFPTESSKAEVSAEWAGGSCAQELVFEDKEADGFDVSAALDVLKDQGMLVLGSGTVQELGLLAAELKKDADCIVVRAEAAENEAQTLKNMLSALEAGMTEKYDADVAGIMAFNHSDESDAVICEETLKNALRNFGDMRLIHDQLKGAYIALLIDAGAYGAHIAQLAKEVMENGVCTVIAADTIPAGVPEERTMTVLVPTVENMLRAAGFEAGDVRMCEK